VRLADLPDAELHRRVSAHPLRRGRSALAVVGVAIVGAAIFQGLWAYAGLAWLVSSALAVWPTGAERELRRRFGPRLDALIADAAREGARDRILFRTRLHPGPAAVVVIDREAGRARVHLLSSGWLHPREGRTVDVPCPTRELAAVARAMDVSALEAQPETELPVGLVWIDADGAASGWAGDGLSVSGDAHGVKLVRRMLELVRAAAEESSRPIPD